MFTVGALRQKGLGEVAHLLFENLCSGACILPRHGRFAR
jgi:hypothetical protein